VDVTPFWLAGKPVTSDLTLTVTSPYDGRDVAIVGVAAPQQVENAVATANGVRHEFAALPAYARADALAHVSGRLADRSDELARQITAESGKPLKWARAEVARAVGTFRFAAEEARRFDGTLQRLDTDAGGTGRMALVRRFSKGAVLGITPFNFPLNLVAHKVAPALAVGAPIVVKPAPATPLSALVLGELLAETDLPAGVISVLPIPNDRAGELVRDPRLAVVSFTGSVPVGWAIKESVPRKHVTLELGGNAAAVVCADADLDYAASRIAMFANYQGGQSCIAVQRVLIDCRVYDETVARIVGAVDSLVTGDPSDERTDVGPLIDESAARRVASWVEDAVADGATLLAGGIRNGAAYAPTVLADVPVDAKVCTEEVFGPVLIVAPFDTIEEAFAGVNSSRFGLQTGIFTRDIKVAFLAHRELEVGGVVIGDVPSYRADQMPYGGVKDSGVGREGLRAAMIDYTDERVLVLTNLDL
jgi:acyl-CoA reductase-like NAD-dependent aldehyde dehydrogenase